MDIAGLSVDMVDDMVDNVEDGISALFSECVLTVVLGCVERPPGCVKPPPLSLYQITLAGLHL